MRITVLLFFLHIFTVTASAQNQPYHTFEYDVPAAYYTTDDATIPNRLFSSGKVVGDLLINECTTHKEYMSGIRFIFKDKENDQTEMAMFALKCEIRTGKMYASWLRRVKNSDGEFEDIIHMENLLQARIKTRVSVSVEFKNNTVSFIVGNQSFIQKLTFDTKEIELIGIGSNGIARFFEESLIS